MQWCYIAFFTIFELGSALCGAAQSSGMLIVGRAIAGVGAAGISSGAYTVLSAAVPLEKRPGKPSHMNETLDSLVTHTDSDAGDAHGNCPAGYNLRASGWRRLHNGLHLALV